MAIKVKHEGDITSRVYASAAGGKGKRQAEDAKVLASMQRGGNGGGGGGTSGGARAGGSAPTMSAPTSTAPLGSAGQLISPRNTFAQQKELKEIDNAAAMERQDRSDSAAMDRLIFQRETQTEARNAEQKWRTEEAEKARQERLDAERREQQRRSYAEQGYSQEQILMLEDNDRKRLDINTDPNASQEQKDQALFALEEERKKIGNPLKPPKSPQEEYNDSIIVDEKTGIRYRKNSRGDFERVEDAPAEPVKPQSAQEIWNGAFVAPNGTRYIVDGRGGIVPIADPSAKVAEEAQRRRSAYILEKLQEIKENWDSGKNGAFDPQKIAKEIAAEYDAAYGGSAPLPTSTPGQEPPAGDGAQPQSDKPLPVDEEEKKNKWGSFAR